MQPKRHRKTIRKDPPNINRMQVGGKVWQFCGHTVYEWSDVSKCCLACKRAVEGKVK